MDRAAEVPSSSSTGIATANTAIGHNTPIPQAKSPATVAKVLKKVRPRTDQIRENPNRRLSFQSGSSPT